MVLTTLLILCNLLDKIGKSLLFTNTQVLTLTRGGPHFTKKPPKATKKPTCSDFKILVVWIPAAGIVPS